MLPDADQHGVLRPDPPRDHHPAHGVRGAAGVRTATHQRQVLELCVLQIYLCVWCHERKTHGRSRPLVLLVQRLGFPAPPRPALQRPIRICE